MKTIFIGSASEQKPRAMAEQLASALAAASFIAKPWWKTFEPSDYTLDKLCAESETVDGSVFIWTGDDKGWYRDKEHNVPRDNVILEYGMFVARLGRRKTVILTEAGTRLPSDVTGITYVPTNPDLTVTCKQIVDHFRNVFDEDSEGDDDREQLAVVVDPRVSSQVLEGPSKDWCQRSLYYGTDGARGWLAAIREPDYFPAEEKNQLRAAILELISRLDVHTFVSLGPGNAWIDRPMVDKLKTKNPWLQYVPVDISDGLLQCAMSTVSDVARVPIGILSDFEERPAFVARQLRQYAGSPRLFSILGNTFGNLDLGELRFLANLRKWMGPNDWVLVDACVKGKSWSVERGRRATTSAYSEGERRWLATGVSRRTGDSLDKVIREFERRMEIREGKSDVADTYSKLLYDTASASNIFTLRRYSLDKLSQCFRDCNFAFEAPKEITYDDVRGDAVFLLKKKE